MTRLVVRVVDAAEAVAAAAGGADVVELRFATLGSRERKVARAVRDVFAGTLRLGSEDGRAADLLAAAEDLGIDEVLIAGDAAERFSRDMRRTAALVARLTGGSDDAAAIRRLSGQIDRVVIESDAGTRLVDRIGIARLGAMAEACRAAELPVGFAGGLEAPDIPRLLVLRPDTLGFDAAVRSGHRADGTLLPDAIEALRCLIPREDGASSTADETGVRDTIFVRDFVVALSIGAYQAEEKRRQRVRFSVEATVIRRAGPPRDMRDVFSYDVIVETIRMLAERGHVVFVETLAEEIAAALLLHTGIEGVTIEVAKLDVIDGAVGIRIRRGRPA